jgi:hypothetical protein
MMNNKYKKMNQMKMQNKLFNNHHKIILSNNKNILYSLINKI